MITDPSFLGFYDVFLVGGAYVYEEVTGTLVSPTIRDTVLVLFVLMNVFDVCVHSSYFSVDFYLRILHHTLMSVLVGMGPYSTALLFLRTHLYIVIAFHFPDGQGKPRLWLLTLMALDETYATYLLLTSPSALGISTIPFFTANLLLRPIIYRATLPDTLPLKMQIEFSYRVALGVIWILTLASHASFSIQPAVRSSTF